MQKPHPVSPSRTLLGGLTADAFLRRHWQRRPLLVRGAIPGFAGFLDRASLLSLATRDDVQSRLVLREGRRWSLEHGPFTRSRLRRLPARNWSVLVQGVDRILPDAAALLARFAFVPWARLDDLMVSLAPPGGGVGPHFDSYDVFLLQGPGRRRWQTSAATDPQLVAGAPLKLLRRFTAEETAVLDPGDMLYLPPRHAHEGVALTDCITYSIGFRAPGAQELASRFLEFLAERVERVGVYADPGLRPARHPGAIDAAMVARVDRLIGRIDWRRADIARFLGKHLTEPAPEVVFTPPRPALSARAFGIAARTQGVVTALATRLLYAGGNLFINGEALEPATDAMRVLRGLADRRRIAPAVLQRAAPDTIDLLHEWYRSGYIAVDTACR